MFKNNNKKETKTSSFYFSLPQLDFMSFIYKTNIEGKDGYSYENRTNGVLRYHYLEEEVKLIFSNLQELHDFMVENPEDFYIDPKTLNLVIGEEELRVRGIKWTSNLRSTFVKLVVLDIVLAMRKKREEIVPFADKSWKESGKGTFQT